jgi:UPF0042 nucleotide-binding protein
VKGVQLVVVTGLSGSGKTAALKALEDLGFFCVDNLPAPLLPKFLELSVLSGGEIQKVAVGMDLRERHFLDRYREAFDEVAGLGIRAEILYLEASEEVLVRRFSETRRRHPLAGDRSVTHGIREERLFLEELKGGSDRVIDTSEMNVHDLKKALWEYFKEGPESHTLQVNLVSFGYRYGIPHEADVLLDVRFLPNPHFVAALKNHVGTEESVQEFVLRSEESKEFLRRVSELIAYLLPLYEKEGKTYVTVAIGCTGGKHRSVTLIEELKRRLAGTSRPLQVLHRDIEK